MIVQDKLIVHEEQLMVHDKKLMVHDKRLMVHEDKPMVHKDKLTGNQDKRIVKQGEMERQTDRHRKLGLNYLLLRKKGPLFLKKKMLTSVL